MTAVAPSSVADREIDASIPLPANAVAHFAPLLLASPVAISLSTLADGRVIDANDAFLRLFGYLRDEVIGRTSIELGLFADPAQREAAVAAMRTAPPRQAIEVAVVTRTGATRNVRLWPEIVDVDGAPCLLTQIFDVTRQEPELSGYRNDADTAALLHAVFAAAAEGIVVQDASGRIVLANPAAERILGLSSAQITGRTARDRTWRATREDGTPLAPEDHPSVYTLRTGLPRTDVVMAVTVEDRPPVWVSVTTRPVQLPGHDAPNGVVASFFDVTERRRLEEAVRESDERLRFILEASGVGTWTLDVGSGEVVWSDQLKRIFGVAPDADLTFDQIMTLMHPDDRLRAAEAMKRTLTNGEDYDLENRAVSPTGEVRWIAGRGRAIPGSDGRPTRMVGIGYDITARKRAEEALQATERRFRLLLEAAPDGIVIVDAEGRIAHANRQIEHLFGYAADELRGRPIEVLVPERERGIHVTHRATYAAAPRLRAMGAQMQLCGRRADGTQFPVEVSLSPLQADEEHLVVAVVRDVTARKVMEERLKLQATRDALTGLFNRVSFVERVEDALAHGRAVAVLFLDLDGFKLVNDTLGHDAGDQLLVEVGQRLTACVRQGDIAARLGGDEFTVLLEGADAAQATAVADRMVAAIRQPVTLDGHRRQITASIGIALGRPGRSKAGALLREADVALYQAKAGGKNQVAVFAPAMGTQARRRVRLDAELREAIERDALELHYQPQVDLATGALVGVEALVRWAHPSRGMTAPADFLPLAEETGTIVPLGEWVLREACRQLRRWREVVPAARNIVVGVNLAAHQLRLPDLADRIAAILATEGVAAAGLALEVTEQVMTEELDARVSGLAALDGLGVRLTIDDFGSGLGSLGYLRSLPIRGLKIDRSFVGGLERDPKTMAIVEAVTTLADRVGLRVIAEGIETAAAMRLARSAGCTYGQGFLFSPPVPASEIGEMLACGTVFDVVADVAPVSVGARVAGGG